MYPILAPRPGLDRHVAELVGISRAIVVRETQLATALASVEPDVPLPLGDAGTLVLTGPFEPLAGGRWRARARLHGRGPRLVPYATVELDVSPWSRDASEVHLRPVARSAHAWGVRRLRRYLDLGRRAVDALAEHVEHRDLRPASIAWGRPAGASGREAGAEHRARPAAPRRAA